MQRQNCYLILSNWFTMSGISSVANGRNLRILGVLLPHPRIQSDLSPSCYDCSYKDRTHKTEARDEPVISWVLETFHTRHVCLYLPLLLQATFTYTKKGDIMISSFNSSQCFFLNAVTPALLRCFASLFTLSSSNGSAENRQLLFFQAILLKLHHEVYIQISLSEENTASKCMYMQVRQLCYI